MIDFKGYSLFHVLWYSPLGVSYTGWFIFGFSNALAEILFCSMQQGSFSLYLLFHIASGNTVNVATIVLGVPWIEVTGVWS